MTRVAIVTARPASGDDLHARHARSLALGLAEAGLFVEHLAADHALAPRLWDSVRQRARAFDVVHVLGIRALPAVFAAHGRTRAVVVSPQSGPGPISMLRRLLNMPSGRASRALLEMADRIVCSSPAESARMAQIVPRAGERMRVVPLGVDTASVRHSEPLPGVTVSQLASSDAVKFSVPPPVLATETVRAAGLAAPTVPENDSEVGETLRLGGGGGPAGAPNT